MIYFIGNILALVSWLPQLKKIWTTKDVSGFSIKGYVLLILGMLILLTHASILGDSVFVTFTVINAILGSSQVASILYWRHREKK